MFRNIAIIPVIHGVLQETTLLPDEPNSKKIFDHVGHGEKKNKYATDLEAKPTLNHIIRQSM